MALVVVQLQMLGGHETTGLYLDGLPALQRCHVSFHSGGVGAAKVCLTQAGVGYQDSLQELTLRSVGSGVRLEQLSGYIMTLPTLRRLTVQNLGLTDLDWLDITWTTLPPAPLRSLDLDGNDALQLSEAATAALRKMTALKTLSMRKGSAAEHGGAHGGGAADAAWSPESVRCIAQLVAARPDMMLHF